MDNHPTIKAPTEEAARQINQLMGDEGYTGEEKIAIRRELNTLIRKPIHDRMLKRQSRRSSI